MCELLNEVLSQYDLKGTPIENNSYGFGHINKTMKVTTTIGKYKKQYILQRINKNLFTDVDALMRNIEKVSAHLQQKCLKRGGNPSREVLTIVKTKEGKLFSEFQNEYYRIYDYIENSICLQTTKSPRIFGEVGKAFGQFQNDLYDFDATTLKCILPEFHNTDLRYNSFLTALNSKHNHRARLVEDVAKEFIRKKNYKAILVEKEKAGDLPLRVTHNDTKLNNVVLDKRTKKSLAVLDLDTVMPSTICYDFGDAIRYGACKSKEDEINLEKVEINLKLIESYTHKYLLKFGDYISTNELDLLAISPLIISYELGLRFLTDYLNGDKYFKVTRKDQNLDRAKVQLKLVQEFEKNYNKIEKIIKKCK